MSKQVIHQPTFRLIRGKQTPHLWEVYWVLGGAYMSAPVHPNDRAYIEELFDVEVDTAVPAETYEYLIIKEKPATAPEKEIEK